MFLCTLTGHFLIKEQWKTCIVWEVLQETLNCLLNLWNNFFDLPFFKGDKKFIFRGIPDASQSPFSCFSALTTRFKNYFAKQKPWHTQIHPVGPRVNDELKGCHAFLHRNQRAHQLSYGLVVCTTGTLIPAHLKVHHLHQTPSPWGRQALVLSLSEALLVPVPAHRSWCGSNAPHQISCAHLCWNSCRTQTLRV